MFSFIPLDLAKGLTGTLKEFRDSALVVDTFRIWWIQKKKVGCVFFPLGDQKF